MSWERFSHVQSEGAPREPGAPGGSHMNQPIKYLEGTRVYLRPWESDDVDWLYHSVNNDAEARRLTGTPAAFSRAQIAGYLERQSGDPSRASFAVVRQESDELVGEVVLNEIDSRNRSANFRIFIDAHHTGRGCGTEATHLMLDYGFGILNLHRIELDVYTINPRAVHVYEKAGFVKEGVKRQNWYYNHQYYDSIVMSMLEDDYRARCQ